MIPLLYRRVSTGDQANSLDVQEALLASYCTQFDQAPRIFEDEDVSGGVAMAKRPGGGALLSAVQHLLGAGEPAVVVCSKQDRLGRDTLDIISTIRWFWEQQVVPHFVAESGPFPRTPQNEFLMEIKASASQYERNLIVERTRTVLRHKLANAELYGTVPFGKDCEYTFADGYKLVVGKALFFGGKERQRRVNGTVLRSAEPDPEASRLMAEHGPVTSKTLIENPTEREWRRQMETWRAAGVGYHTIARRLNESGVSTKQGKVWQAGNVHSVLHHQ